MKTIHKNPEPASLTEHRSSTHADYDNYPDKGTLRASLVKEQRGLCCYCLCRIRPDQSVMKIAHWHSQDKHPAEQLTYANLLGACKGGEGQPKKQQHCDTRQANLDFSRNPADALHRVEDFVRFEGNGRIASHDPAFDVELNETLNLNAAILPSNRKAVLSAFLEVLPRRDPLSRSDLEKWLRQWYGDSITGDLNPFCMVVVYWLVTEAPFTSVRR